ncbi:CPCC family cysteine-rich protein [Chryseobacterium sp. PMSZPI]|uniref:CPCC family cysteine-rich protein n=1 Tax=Chryseobacterium sp. PMSZPI TaxID=1033900 RepID=UPI000C34B993|nr:CPCC family cysteine-rich protein [Chryseobacterium sp. PMSZPI]PKF73282.1 hypothetical protein CW752_14745 [Chryseobacterium sp. PMSZPI]
MINLNLNTAIDILSLDQYSKMTDKEIEELAEAEGIKDEEIFNYLKYKYIGIRVSYIEEKIKTLYNLPINVSGKARELISCSCCNYKTILEKGNYEICKVCFWEDDGITDESKYSAVNHMTLREAIESFNKIGVISDVFLKFSVNDNKLRYYKEN